MVPPTQQQMPHDYKELGPVYIATANLFALSTQVTYTRWLGMLAILSPLLIAAVIIDSDKWRVGLISVSLVVALTAALLLYHNSIFQGFRRKMGEELEAAMTGEASGHPVKIPRSFRAQRILFDEHRRIRVDGADWWPPMGRWGRLKLITTWLPHQADLITAGLAVIMICVFLGLAAFEWHADEPLSGEETQLVLLLEQYRLTDVEGNQAEFTRLLSFCDDRLDRAGKLGNVCSSISGKGAEPIDDAQVDLLLRQLLQ